MSSFFFPFYENRPPTSVWFHPSPGPKSGVFLAAKSTVPEGQKITRRGMDPQRGNLELMGALWRILDSLTALHCPPTQCVDQNPCELGEMQRLKGTESALPLKVSVVIRTAHVGNCRELTSPMASLQRPLQRFLHKSSLRGGAVKVCCIDWLVTESVSVSARYTAYV